MRAWPLLVAIFTMVGCSSNDEGFRNLKDPLATEDRDSLQRQLDNSLTVLHAKLERKGSLSGEEFLDMAALYFLKNDYPRALEYAGYAYPLTKKKNAPLWFMAAASYRKGQLEKALQILQKRPKSLKSDAALANLEGIILVHQGKVPEAIHTWEKALTAVKGKSLSLIANLAIIHLWRHDFAASKQYSTQLPQQDLAFLKHVNGIQLAAEGDTKMAIKELDSAYTLQPDPVLLWNLAFVYLLDKDPQNAKNTLTTLASYPKIDPIPRDQLPMLSRAIAKADDPKEQKAKESVAH